ncbi:MAG: aldolase/citrate lyase family protein [Pseudomonadota bacterium]|nr:aldolase/citrate lyase family protein [Pseudomonadota bacterium]
MKKNNLRDLWSKEMPAINGWLSMPSAFGAEIMANQGFDSLTLDIQHGVIDYQDALRMLQSLGAYSVAPLTRVSWLDPGLIMKVLDAGFYGIICPMINNKKQAEKFVSYCRYPPLGSRSYGPTRALYSLGSDYYPKANDQIICLAMIETAEAMNNLEEIVRTPGLDGVYIGPSDLSLGIGNGQLPPGFDREETQIVNAIKTILKAAKAAGIRAGIHCGSPEYATRAISWGFDLVTIGSDARLLATAAKKVVSDVRTNVETGSCVNNEDEEDLSGGYGY